ncbi:hypothetical protein CDAR_240091 [Caerostris darwini]|uniref:Uncharacterized protein n=1 Tax=Caerostris darwini TaxID=1538125 RepID=A0AAV4V4K1_9ARAC|nr:hypothetical protein CDAR_240091 [Caerostris darwini]
MKEFTDNDEDDILIAPKRIKRTPDNHTKPKYDLDLSSNDNNADKSIPHYVISLGKGLLMEVGLISQPEEALSHGITK